MVLTVYKAELKPRSDTAGLWIKHHSWKPKGEGEGPAVQAWFGKSCGQKAGHMPVDTDFL